VILGNGAIGTLSAIRLKQQHPSKSICLIGSKKRRNGASAAAGAMCNVFAEIEETYSEPHSKLMELSLWYGIAGREGWLELIASNSKLKKLKTASDTLVFLKKDSSNFEKLNFRKSRETAIEYGVAKDLGVASINKFFRYARDIPSDAFKVEGEFALDTKIMFDTFDDICIDLGISILDSEVIEVDLSSSNILTKNEKMNFERLVVALGSNSAAVFPKGYIQNLVQGVGTAIEIGKKGMRGYFSEQNVVIRTVNRGGAQCGFHFVPRNDGFYLGAGNYIMEAGRESDHRLETIRYLFNTFEKEVCGVDISYSLEGGLVKGHRPRSLDGFPMIGSLSSAPNVFIATGTNRAGLTWAPKIVNQIITWSRGEEENPPFKNYLAPDRKLIDFGKEEEAITYYSESRIGAALEHERIPKTTEAIEGERIRLQQYARHLLADVRRVVKSPTAVPHPDHWAVILDKPSICFNIN
jgi:glycine/D-amino acid oxidase-like deaminating enzyme